jgi:hypothetical protein
MPLALQVRLGRQLWSTRMSRTTRVRILQALKKKGRLGRPSPGNAQALLEGEPLGQLRLRTSYHLQLTSACLRVSPSLLPSPVTWPAQQPLRRLHLPEAVQAAGPSKPGGLPAQTRPSQLQSKVKHQALHMGHMLDSRRD